MFTKFFLKVPKLLLCSKYPSYVYYILLSCLLHTLMFIKYFHVYYTLFLYLLNTLHCTQPRCTGLLLWYIIFVHSFSNELFIYSQALQAIQDALADPAVRSGHRLAIYLRAETICNKPNSPYREWLQHLSHEPLVELPKVL